MSVVIVTQNWMTPIQGRWGRRVEGNPEMRKGWLRTPKLPMRVWRNLPKTIKHMRQK